eukprot:scaffold1828_cov272-Chaetoceros_neogracile.AAC.27
MMQANVFARGQHDDDHDGSNASASVAGNVPCPSRARHSSDPNSILALTPSLFTTGFLDWPKIENVKLYIKAFDKLDFKLEVKEHTRVAQDNKMISVSNY